ncbi:E3 ubiquitin ligase complex SCF subunit sconC, variant [Tothia fuscella]|uniref:E3 ubiquitin ligase complex SCF subunit n=1 Tax=Tothia fuscella TaxID=1048955 RepID=A0A9P4U1F7_9PEZI|nr:E3 ubiquitin ligase complex SCF subunit sconC, variant [Tothia fuscella]
MTTPTPSLSAPISTITLSPQEGEERGDITIDRDVANLSITIRNSLSFEDESEQNQAIPIFNVTGPVLKKIIEWCEHHRGDPAVYDDGSKDAGDGNGTAMWAKSKGADVLGWDKKYMDGMDRETLFDVIMAANYLDIKALLDIGCKTVANMIKGKSPGEIRTMFGIENDFSAEDIEQIRKENEWAEDR